MKLDLTIEPGSRIAVYRQLVTAISEAVKNGRLAAGDIVPSMNALSEELGISKETVKRAYGELTKMGILEAHQGKGFFVSDSAHKDRVSVLFLMDSFSIYKQEIVRGFHQEISLTADETILLFNQDINLFEYFLNENLGKFDYYLVSPHFCLEPEVQSRARRLLKRIPNRKLIMIDRWMTEIPGNYGAVYQDFENDVYDGLAQGRDRFEGIRELKVITLPTSLYGPLMENKVRSFCKDNSLGVRFLHEVPTEIEKGDVFLILTSQLDSGLIALVDNAKGMNVGSDYFIISYNDSPIDRVVLNGLTTISTDFNMMGREAARMINEKSMWKTHIDFRMNKRNTF